MSAIQFLSAKKKKKKTTWWAPGMYVLENFPGEYNVLLS